MAPYVAARRAERTFSENRSSTVLPYAAISSGSTLSCALPKRSTHSTSATRRSPSTRVSGRTPGSSVCGSMSSPSASSGTPLARWAAAGPKTSRPANVGPGAGSWYTALVKLTARSAPPAMATADASSPLSGPTNTPAPPPTSIATARRSVPTPGSTTASTMPRATYCTARARARAPPRTSKGAMAWVRSITAACGAISRMTECTTPTNSSSWPKSERNEMVSYRVMPRRR